MIFDLCREIWFGDFASVSESNDRAQSIINVGAHNFRKQHWQELSRLEWDVWYFRLVFPSREDYLSDQYMRILNVTIEEIITAEKFPLLCHCRHGVHRGAATALLAYWHLRGKTIDALEDGFNKIVRVMPIFATEESPTNQMLFKRSILKYCKERSLEHEFSGGR